MIFFLFTYDIRQETILFKLCETVKLFLQTSLFPVSIYLPIYLCIYVRIYLCMYVQYFQYICYDYHTISKNICIKTETVLPKENKNNNLKLSQISISHDCFYFPLSLVLLKLVPLHSGIHFSDTLNRLIWESFYLKYTKKSCHFRRKKL